MELPSQVLRAHSPGGAWRFSPTAAKSYASLDCVMTLKFIESPRRPAVSSWRVTRDTDGPKKPIAVGNEVAGHANRDFQYSPARTER